MSRIHAFTAALAFAVLPAAAEARVIQINNPSFEATQLGDGQYIRSAVSGWLIDVGAEGGTQNPSAALFSAVPDGSNSAYLGSYLTGPFGAQVTARMSQVLDETVARNMRYTLSVDIGRRADGYDLPVFTASLMAGDMTLATGEYTNADIEAGEFRTLTFSFDALQSSMAPLKIAFQSFYDPAQGLSYRQVNFDNVRLEVTAIPTSAVPEPTTWASMIAGFAIAGFGLRLRRSKPVEAGHSPV